MFRSHIIKMDAKAASLPIPEFPKTLTWYNSPPLSIQEDLKGKIVVLDFWTYCCINCIHILKELSRLEKKYANAPVVFIGVHSAKFDNEKDSENIRQAILRYHILHPVVNDHEMILWRTLGIRSWPTVVIISPYGNLLYAVSGENNEDNIDAFISSAIDYYGPNAFNPSPIPLQQEHEKFPVSPLSFPTKLAVDSEGKRLFISDSNHHRLIITTTKGDFIEEIGSQNAGLKDGHYQECSFNNPQGLSFANNKLYVADTGNHALREIDLIKKTTRTLAGSGIQGRDYRGGNKGKAQELSSPWDIVAINPILYIAMAGTHQIWIYDLEKDRAMVYSGSGAEQHANHQDILRACWAQPSGLSYAKDLLFIADSESSSIRAIDLKRKETVTLTGGDPANPYNLFDFGDRVGAAGKAKFQHPIGLIWLEKEQKLIIADTYNHRLKIYSPATCQVMHFVGSGRRGKKDGKGNEAEFNEPNGLALTPDGNTLFVADTNNHLIRIVDVKNGNVSTLDLSSIPQAKFS